MKTRETLEAENRALKAELLANINYIKSLEISNYETRENLRYTVLENRNLKNLIEEHNKETLCQVITIKTLKP